MRIPLFVLVLALSAALYSGCSTHPIGRLNYQESQFANRVEYLRFCQTNDLPGRHCD
jgi:hypothetical protein